MGASRRHLLAALDAPRVTDQWIKKTAGGRVAATAASHLLSEIIDVAGGAHPRAAVAAVDVRNVVSLRAVKFGGGQHEVAHPQTILFLHVRPDLSLAHATEASARPGPGPPWFLQEPCPAENRARLLVVDQGNRLRLRLKLLAPVRTLRMSD